MIFWLLRRGFVKLADFLALLLNQALAKNSRKIAPYVDL
jgi:hypothetical protein